MYLTLYPICKCGYVFKKIKIIKKVDRLGCGLIYKFEPYCCPSCGEIIDGITTTIESIKEDFYGKERTVYSVNNTNNNISSGGSMTTSEVCPNCHEKNIFRVYESDREFETKRYCIAVYDCKCPNCKEEFEILDLYDKLED